MDDQAKSDEEYARKLQEEFDTPHTASLSFCPDDQENRRSEFTWECMDLDPGSPAEDVRQEQEQEQENEQKIDEENTWTLLSSTRYPEVGSGDTGGGMIESIWLLPSTKGQDLDVGMAEEDTWMLPSTKYQEFESNPDPDVGITEDLNPTARQIMSRALENIQRCHQETGVTAQAEDQILVDVQEVSPDSHPATPPASTSTRDPQLSLDRIYTEWILPESEIRELNSVLDELNGLDFNEAIERGREAIDRLETVGREFLFVADQNFQWKAEVLNRVGLKDRKRDPLTDLPARCVFDGCGPRCPPNHAEDITIALKTRMEIVEAERREAMVDEDPADPVIREVVSEIIEDEGDALLPTLQGHVVLFWLRLRK